MLTHLKYYWQLMRFHKPVGTFLVLWPAMWGLWLANQGIPPIKLLVIFVLGAVVMRAAGCVINDIADKEFDRHVMRTKARPLAQGLISLQEALILFVVLAIIALILVLMLNRLCLVIAIAAMLLTVIYPFLKRWTNFPQVILGIVFGGVPVLMGYAASINYLPLISWYVFALASLWPLMYDTAYAITDYPDDVKIGVKSTAVKFSNYSHWFILILQLILLVGFAVLGVWQKLEWPYLVACFVVLILFIYQQDLLRKKQPFAAFINNQWVGLVIWLGITVGYWRGMPWIN